MLTQYLYWKIILLLWIALGATPAAEENTDARTFTTCLRMIIREHGATRYPAHSASLGTEHCRLSALFSSHFRALFVFVSILKWYLSSVRHFYFRAAGRTGVTRKQALLKRMYPDWGVRSPVANICTKCPNIKILCSLPPRDMYLFISYYFHNKQRIFS